MIRLQIRSLIRKRLGETTAAFWLDTELNTWIDDACTDIAFRTKCLKTDSFLTPSFNIGEYSLNSSFPNILSIDDVYFFQSASSDTTNSTFQRLVSTDRLQLDIEYPGWKSVQAGVPTHYYYDREDDLFGIYMKPDTNNAGTNYCRVYYRKKHTNISDDNSTPDIPENLHLGITDYVVALGFEQRGFGDKANDAWQKYFAKIKDYEVERMREKEDDDIVSRNYRNIY